MAEKRIHNPDKSSSADVSRVSRSRDQDGHHTHHTHIYGKKPQLLCPVTVLVDSQVSDRCSWATCLFEVGRGDKVPDLSGIPDFGLSSCN